MTQKKVEGYKPPPRTGRVMLRYDGYGLQVTEVCCQYLSARIAAGRGGVGIGVAPSYTMHDVRPNGDQAARILWHIVDRTDRVQVFHCPWCCAELPTDTNTPAPAPRFAPSKVLKPPPCPHCGAAGSAFDGWCTRCGRPAVPDSLE